MVYAMDTLGYAKRLRDAGVPQQQAEAHAEAARDFVMGELVTKTDLQGTAHLLEEKIGAVKGDLQAAVQLIEGRIEAVKADLQAAKQLLEAKIDAQTLRLTVRLGGIMAAGIALLAAVQKLT
jgi:hypothetical protein